MDREYFLKNFIMDLRHKRFNNKEEIINKILIQNEVFDVSLNNGYKDKGLENLDYLLIGTVNFVDNDYFDFELWYLLDNNNNIYITETHILD